MGLELEQIKQNVLIKGDEKSVSEESEGEDIDKETEAVEISLVGSVIM